MKRVKRDWPVIITRAIVIIYSIALISLIIHCFTGIQLLLNIAIAGGIIVLTLAFIVSMFLYKEIIDCKKDMLDELHSYSEEDKDDRS